MEMPLPDPRLYQQQSPRHSRQQIPVLWEAEADNEQQP